MGNLCGSPAKEDNALDHNNIPKVSKKDKKDSVSIFKWLD